MNKQILLVVLCALGFQGSAFSLGKPKTIKEAVKKGQKQLKKDEKKFEKFSKGVDKDLRKLVSGDPRLAGLIAPINELIEMVKKLIGSGVSTDIGKGTVTETRPVISETDRLGEDRVVYKLTDGFGRISNQTPTLKTLGMSYAADLVKKLHDKSGRREITPDIFSSTESMMLIEHGKTLATIYAAKNILKQLKNFIKAAKNVAKALRAKEFIKYLDKQFKVIEKLGLESKKALDDTEKAMAQTLENWKTEWENLKTLLQKIPRGKTLVKLQKRWDDKPMQINPTSYREALYKIKEDKDSREAQMTTLLKNHDLVHAILKYKWVKALSNFLEKNK